MARPRVSKIFVGVIFALALGLCRLHAQRPDHNYRPPSGYVPDAATAIRIAVAIWEPIYGPKRIAAEKPFQATLKGDVWTVTGLLPTKTVGGVAVAVISKKDGRILRVSHGK